MFHIFLLCSGLAALVNIAVGYLLYGMAGLNGTFGYPVSVALAFISGMGVSFVLNRRFTYPPSGRARQREMMDFFAVSVIGLTLTTVIAQALHLGMPEMLAQVTPAGVLPETLAHIAAVGITAIYSFIAHKYVSFRRGTADFSATHNTQSGRAGQ